MIIQNELEYFQECKDKLDITNYDIIYSIPCHESPECVIDLIKNINYFNSNFSICIILHINLFLIEMVWMAFPTKPVPPVTRMVSIYLFIIYTICFRYFIKDLVMLVQ
jgi:hypothetical protein